MASGRRSMDCTRQFPQQRSRLFMEVHAMNKKILSVFVMTVALVFGAVAGLSAGEVKDSGIGVRVEIPEAMFSLFEDYGVDITEIAEGSELSPSVRKAILYLNADADFRAEVNAIVNGALREAREATGKPTYLEFGPLYWGYWLSEDLD